MRLLSVDIHRCARRVCLVGRVKRLSDRKVPWAISEAHLGSHVNGEGEIYFEFPDTYHHFLRRSGDPFAIAMLLPSMAAGEPLQFDVPVSQSLLFNLTGVRDIFHVWYPRFRRVPIEGGADADPVDDNYPRSGATFFSGGVDSFYTLLKRLHHEPLPVPLKHTIFMHGVEQSLESSRAAANSQEKAERIAAQLGVDCIVGTTNLRTLFPLHWENYYFGSVLSAVASSLADGLSHVCIPSGFSYAHVVPHGSSPLVDDRFSTPSIRIVHDGSEASRASKTAHIVEWNPQLVLENLRVCIRNDGGDFNCGQCRKCVRTAVALEALGVRASAHFRDTATAHWDRKILEDHPMFTLENLELARQYGRAPELVCRLERIVRKVRRYESLATYARNSTLERLLPLYRKAREAAGGGPRMH